MKLLLVFFGLVVSQTSASKLLVSVFYESKCPDSKKFIEEQLAPALQQLQGLIYVKLVPFGKAKSINQGIEGFECQHGPSECRGNMVQDCALDFMSEKSDIEKVNYVNCEMQTLAGTTGNLMCVNYAHVPVEVVRECLISNRGTELQLRSEYLTSNVNLTFVPTITVNGNFNQKIQDSAQHNLLKTLCTMLPRVGPCLC